MDTDQLMKISKDHLWLPFTQMKDYDENPIMIESGDGIKLKDIHGNEYYDAYSSLWLNVHGHRNDAINNAIKAQLDKVAHTTLLGATNVPSTLLAKKLINLTPENLNRVFYSDNGSTSIEISIKVAYQYWQNIGFNRKRKFVTLSNGYHGDTVGTMSVGSIDIYHRIYSSLLFETITLPFPNVYHHPSGDEQVVLKESLQELEQLFEAKHEEIAGMTVEALIQGAGGMNIMPKGYLKGIEQLCKQYNILLIVDEVATGFGRTGKMFAVEHEGVEPDFMTLAKGITGGYLPIAVTLTTEKVYRAFYDDYEKEKTFFHGHSFTGNQLGCVAALTSLDMFEQENLVEKVQDTSIFLQDLLKDIKKLDFVGDVRQLGLMCGIELVKHKQSKEPFPKHLRVGYKATLKMRKLGLLTRPLGDVIVFMPPLISTENDLKEMVSLIKQGIVETVSNI